MDDNKLNDIPDLGDNLNSINKKLEAASNPFKGIEDIVSNKKLEEAANPFKRITDMVSGVNVNRGMYDLASQYEGVGARINKHSNMYDQLFAPSLNVYKMSDAIMHMNDKSNALQIVLGWKFQ